RRRRDPRRPRRPPHRRRRPPAAERRPPPRRLHGWPRAPPRGGAPGQHAARRRSGAVLGQGSRPRRQLPGGDGLPRRPAHRRAISVRDGAAPRPLRLLPGALGARPVPPLLPLSRRGGPRRRAYRGRLLMRRLLFALTVLSLTMVTDRGHSQVDPGYELVRGTAPAL